MANNRQEIRRRQKLNQRHQQKVAAKRKKEQKKAEVTLHRLIVDIDKHPHNYHTYYDLGTFLVELHNFTQAEELFMKALGLFAQKNQKARDTLTYGLANVYYAAGSFDKAIKYFNQVSDRKLKLDSYIMLSQSYMSKKDYKRAVLFALTAHNLRKQNPTVNSLLGANLLALGDVKPASRFYRIALKADPQSGKINFNLGICAMVLGMPFRKYFQQAKRLDRKYFDRGQKRLADIERFIQINRRKRNKR